MSVDADGKLPSMARTLGQDCIRGRGGFVESFWVRGGRVSERSGEGVPHSDYGRSG